MKNEKVINELNREIIITHTPTAGRLLKKKHGVDAFTLYNFYCYCASLQLTSQIWATDKFCMKGLSWGKTRFRRAKNILIKEKIIDQTMKHEKGRIRRWYIHVHYLNGFTSHPKNNPLVKQPSGKRETNALDKKIITPPYISPPKKFSSLKSISNEDLVEISEKYKVPLNFVKLQLEKMTNWLEAKGKCYKNYKRGLMNWVLREAQGMVERRQFDDRKRGIDARGV